METFLAAYKAALIDQMTRHPEMYRHALTQWPTVEQAAEAQCGWLRTNGIRSINTKHPSCKQACKALKINASLVAISQFIAVN